MTDNRTIELLEGLRNVGNLHEFAELFGFDWQDESDWTWHDVAVKMADDIEQAITATLGNDAKPCYATDYTHEHCKYSVNRGWVENVAHGTLTAEQVREAIEEAKAELLESCEYVGDMYQRQSDVLKAFGKMEQAIADELNARAERTKEVDE